MMRLLLGTGEQPDLPGDELATLQEWRSLPDDAILSVPNAARMFAALCKQNAAALRAIFSQAVIDREVPSWVIRFDGTCDPGGYAAWVPATDVQVDPPDADGSRRFRCHLPKKAAGHLHAEATGVRPADLVALLIRRGRRVPAELRQAFSVTTPSAPAAPAATPPPTELAKRAAAGRGPGYEEAIKTALIAAGFDPERLPALRKGKPCPAKRAALNELVRPGSPVTKRVFDDAWKAFQRGRREG